MPSPVIRIVRKKDKLRQKLNALVPGLNEAINEANQTSATELAEAIAKRAPVLTGEYKASINAHPVEDTGYGHNSGKATVRRDQTITTKYRHMIRKGRYKGQTRTRTARAIETLAWGVFALYIWRYLEFGTKNMRKQPHIFGTYRSYRSRIKGRMGRAVRKAVKQVASQ
jgi:HK97 gp10 family phage protein